MFANIGNITMNKLRELAGGSVMVPDEVVARFISRPDFPWLISFPRTGSHWLRMVMELYFEKPALVRVFYYKGAKDFTCYHRHDEDLSISGVKNVLYLYRAPVDTVYSQLNYYNEDTDDAGRVGRWSTLYGRHLSKWLFDETFTEKKTVITYEGLKASMADEFTKVCAHFGQELDLPRLEAVMAKVSKEALKKKTSHDKQVVNLSDSYRRGREDFRESRGGQVLELVFSQDERLRRLF